jgi:hypothetical protein
MNQVFDINRVILFSKLKLNLNRKLFFITSGGFLAIIFIISFFMAYHLPPGSEWLLTNLHNVAFIIMLYGGAVFFGGRSYFEMNTGAKSIEQLMIPASVFEKFIIPALFTSFGWMFFSLVTYEVFAALTNGLWSAIFHLDLGFYNLLEMLGDEKWFTAVKFYFLVHATFFLGSAAFKKYAIPKTALALFIIQNGMNLIGFIFILIFFGNGVNFGFAVDATAQELNIKEWMENGGMQTLMSLSYWGSGVVLPIILYVAAYFKLKEREV